MIEKNFYPVYLRDNNTLFTGYIEIEIKDDDMFNEKFHTDLIEHAKSKECNGLSGAELKQIVHSKVTECMHKVLRGNNI